MTIKNSPSLYVEQGTVYKPIQPVKNAEQRLRREAHKRGVDIFIVSGNDSDHIMESLHYDDRAFDPIVKNFTKKEIFDIVNDVSVEDEIYVQFWQSNEMYDWVKVTHYFDVVAYANSDRYHIEYQPRYVD